MQNAMYKIKQLWEENPVAVIMIASLTAASAAQLLNALANANNSRAWKKEVNRRVRNSRRR